MTLSASKLALCSWSLHPTSPQALVEELKAVGLSRVQLALNPLCTDDAWANAGEVLANAKIEIVSGMMGTGGEDYSTPQTIRATGGFVPDATWEANWQSVQAVAKVAASLGVKCISTHAGFIPPDVNDPKRPVLRERMQQVADYFKQAFGGSLIFETGQETADTLVSFLDELDRENIGVNFDPANMLLYAMGDPIESLAKVLPFVKQVHIKDAIRPAQAGQWGKEVPIGRGEVDWTRFFALLNEASYSGDLVIEREAGDQRVQDIRGAIEYVKKILGDA